MTKTSLPPAPAGRGAAVFSARDLMNVAIFAVIYFVLVFAIAMLGVISPLVSLLVLPLAAVAAGVPFMLFLTRVRHGGMVTLFGTVVALVYLLMGHPWQSTVVTIVCAALADLVLRAGAYRSAWAAIWSYTVFSAWFIGPWIPLFLDRDAYLHSPAMEAMGEEYVEAFDATVTVPAVLGLAAASVVCGFLGALLGSVLLRKHFRKAGLA